MADKKNDGFTVTDRRLFTAEGELRDEQSREQPEPRVQPEPAPAQSEPLDAAPQPAAPAALPGEEAPPPPTAAEQQEQAEAYKRSAGAVDQQAQMSGHSARDLEMTFERFLASMYMTAMLQLGLMHEQGGQPRVDLIAARQTVDTLGLIQEKTKGNLTQSEAEFLQNCLYEVRMAYVEVTNTLAHPPQAPAAGNR